MSDYLTVSEAADRLRVSDSTIRSLIRDGEIPAVQFREGSPWRIPSDEFDDAIDAMGNSDDPDDEEEEAEEDEEDEEEFDEDD